MYRSPVEKRLVNVKKDLEDKILEVDRKVWSLDQKFDRKIDDTFYQFKDKIFTHIDAVLKEIIAMREEQAAHLGQHERIDNRLERDENHTGLPPYAD